MADLFWTRARNIEAVDFDKTIAKLKAAVGCCHFSLVHVRNVDSLLARPTREQNAELRTALRRQLDLDVANSLNGELVEKLDISRIALNLKAYKRRLLAE